SSGVTYFELAAKPALSAGDVGGCCCPRELRVAGDERFVDSPMFSSSLLARVVRGASMPQADSHRSRREACEKRRQDRVAGGLGDQGVERDIGLDELLDALRRSHALEALPEVDLLLGVDPARRQGRGRRLEDAAHLVQLELGLAE